MSKAGPMGHARRRLNYGGDPLRFSPGKRRRYRHKLRRELGTFLAGDGHYPGEAKPTAERAKGRPTRRQRPRGAGA